MFSHVGICSFPIPTIPSREYVSCAISYMCIAYPPIHKLITNYSLTGYVAPGYCLYLCWDLPTVLEHYQLPCLVLDLVRLYPRWLTSPLLAPLPGIHYSDMSISICFAIIPGWAHVCPSWSWQKQQSFHSMLFRAIVLHQC